MGILSTIINKVFGGKKEAAAAPASAPATEVVETVIAEATPTVPADFDVTGYLNELRGQTKEKLAKCPNPKLDTGEGPFAFLQMVMSRRSIQKI